MLIPMLPMSPADHRKRVRKQEEKLTRILIELCECRDDQEKLSEILTVMTEYAITHFKSEEIIMKKFDYPGLVKHKKQHTEFLEKLTKFCMEIVNKRSDPTEQVIDYLDHWIENHFITEDRQLDRFILSAKDLC